MATTSVTPPGYVQRGRELYAEHATEIIASHRDGVYMVPSGSVEGRSYEVKPGRSCECIARDYYEVGFHV